MSNIALSVDRTSNMAHSVKSASNHYITHVLGNQQFLYNVKPHCEYLYFL